MWSPIELVKVRMQLQAMPPSSPGYLGPSAMVRHILRTEGLAGEQAYLGGGSITAACWGHLDGVGFHRACSQHGAASAQAAPC